MMKSRSYDSGPCEVVSTNSEKSTLTSIEVQRFDLQGPSIMGSLQQLRREYLETIKSANMRLYNESDQSQIFVDYDPVVFAKKGDEAKLDSETLNKTMWTDARAEKPPLADTWRNKTKHRAITSNITCFGDGFGEPFATPVSIVLTTGCAPNFMGTSLTDQTEYLVNYRRIRDHKDQIKYVDGELKDPAQYKKTMKLLFYRWLYAQDQRGVEVVLMPLMGGGAYLSVLKDSQKTIALQLINEALFEVIQESQFQNITEVIYALPNTKKPDDKHSGKSEAYNNAVKLLNSTKSKFNEKSAILSIANVDVFRTAQALTQEGKTVGLINAGSDRTLGGYYKQTARSNSHSPTGPQPKPPTLEEMIFNLTNASSVQPLDFNPHTERVNQPYPEHFQAKNYLKAERTPSRRHQTTEARKPTPTSPAIPGHKKSEASRRTRRGGVFVPFNIPWQTNEKRSITARDQAIRILNQARYLHQKYPRKKIGITYSANADQTKDLNKLYREQGWKTDTFKGSSNQGEVMREVQSLLAREYKDLRQVFQVVPISTCLHAGGSAPAPEGQLAQDLKNINEFVANGNVLIGWKNQESTIDFAIGGKPGSVSAGVFKKSDAKEVQNTLKKLATTYPCDEEDIVFHQSNTTTSTRKMHTAFAKNPSAIRSKTTDKSITTLTPENSAKLVEQMILALQQLEEILRALDHEVKNQIEEKKQATWKSPAPRSLGSID